MITIITILAIAFHLLLWVKDLQHNNEPIVNAGDDFAGWEHDSRNY